MQKIYGSSRRIGDITMSTPKYKQVLSYRALLLRNQFDVLDAKLKRYQEANPGSDFIHTLVEQYGDKISEYARTMAFLGQGE